LQLSDLGADLIKVEDPAAGGDVRRYVPPSTTVKTRCSSRCSIANKRSISLDLGDPSGRQVFNDIVAVVDAVLSNRPWSASAPKIRERTDTTDAHWSQQQTRLKS
jgi:crotonobetainyl-CoA:carnitine CoA-transferase CaiB-like acyl-CoA transferase